MEGTADPQISVYPGSKELPGMGQGGTETSGWAAEKQGKKEEGQSNAPTLSYLQKM